MNLTASLKSKELFSKFRGNTLNKALSNALSKTAADSVFKKIRPNLKSKFDLKNRWTESGIRYHSSTSSSLTAVVYSKDYYMVKQETGGVKSPDRSKNWAIPSKMLKQKYRVIPLHKRPKAILKQSNVIYQKKYKKIVEMKFEGKKVTFNDLYSLKPRANYKPRFEFKNEVEIYFEKHIAKNFKVSLGDM